MLNKGYYYYYYDSQVDAGIAKVASRRGVRNAATARQLTLMLLKARAWGPPGVPATQRAHFLLRVPAGCSVHAASPKPVAVYADRAGALGRALDLWAWHFELRNDNHKGGAGPRLRMLDADARPLSTEHTLEKLLRDGLISEGDTLTLEYYTQQQ